ncbi:MAG: F0F1 ATP synthase subunit B [Myxococcaceae bacterium]
MPLLLAESGFLEVKPGLIFWTLVTFAIASYVLRRVAWGPIVTRVDEREKAIQASIDAAKHERAEAEKLLGEQKAAIAQARREAGEMVRKNAEDVERLRADLLAKARAQAEELKADAKRSIEDEKLKAVAEVKGVAAELAIQIAEKLLGEQLDAEKQRKLAQQYLESLGRTASTRPS